MLRVAWCLACAVCALSSQSFDLPLSHNHIAIKSAFMPNGASRHPSRISSTNLGLENVAGTVTAFGDVDSDKFLDTFILSETKTTIDVYLQSTTGRFAVSSPHQFSWSSTITNVVPRDVDFDGRMDMVVVADGGKQLLLVPGVAGGWGTARQISNELVGEILCLDANGDGHLDIFAQKRNQTGTFRGFWMNTGNGQFSWEGQSVDGLVRGTEIRSDLSPIYADMNGDCVADLLVSSTAPDGTEYLELWLYRAGNSPNSHFEFYWQRPLLSGMGQPTVVDFDFDGTLDLIFPRCNPEDCSNEISVRMYANSQMSLCGRLGSTSGCRSTNNLCQVDNEFSFAPFDDETAGVLVNLRPFGVRHFLGLPHTNMLRTGDFNLDGFADVLVTYLDADGANRLLLLRNVEQDGSRTFEPAEHGVQDLEQLTGVFAAAFVDFGETGSSDILAMTQDNSGTNRIHTLANNLFVDAFFLKIMSLNGVCTEWCSGGVKFPNPKPYGVNFPGATFRFTVTNLDARKRLAVGQLFY
eukprot:c17656_g1_i2.p1 GENE.c17656_g1_i2~~c17656_g1_i2.p1  ORF type:complete len:523 (+),score=103.71 c17656_g1_i2:24-1592(+)